MPLLEFQIFFSGDSARRLAPGTKRNEKVRPLVGAAVAARARDVKFQSVGALAI
jgi:hypothetical protein